jgi:hypothetical protein
VVGNLAKAVSSEFLTQVVSAMPVAMTDTAQRPGPGAVITPTDQPDQPGIISKMTAGRSTAKASDGFEQYQYGLKARGASRADGATFPARECDLAMNLARCEVSWRAGTLRLRGTASVVRPLRLGMRRTAGSLPGEPRAPARAGSRCYVPARRE